MERLMRYKTLQCFLAALTMIAFLAPAAYASGTPDAYEAGANTVSEKNIGKTVPGACVVISELQRPSSGFFTGISHAVKRKTRASVLTIILFALQIISAWMLGFLTVV